MGVLKEFEIKVLHLLARDALTAGQIAEVVNAGEFEGYEYTGCGYFLTLRHPALPRERIVCNRPFLTGRADGVTCGFVLFIENGRLTLECHSWGEVAVPEGFRDRDVQVAAARLKSDGEAGA